jgi:hypothetical protein
VLLTNWSMGFWVLHLSYDGLLGRPLGVSVTLALRPETNPSTKVAQRSKATFLWQKCGPVVDIGHASKTSVRPPGPRAMGPPWA